MKTAPPTVELVEALIAALETSKDMVNALHRGHLAARQRGFDDAVIRFNAATDRVLALAKVTQ